MLARVTQRSRLRMYLTLATPFWSAPLLETARRPLAGCASRQRCVLLGACLIALLGAGLGCPRTPAKKPLSPLELAVSPEPRAEADYREAGEAQQRGDTERAYRLYRAFIDVWPRDPLAPYARFALGRLDLDAGKPLKARRWFDEVAKATDTTLAERGRMFAAISASQLGEHAAAVGALRPFVGRTVDPVETGLLLDALANSETATGDQLAALETSDRALRGELSAAQRKRTEARVRSLIDALEPGLGLSRAYEVLPRDGQAWPEVARRLLRKSHQAGSTQRVAAIADDLRKQNVELDDELAALVLRAERPTDADPAVVGAILPLSGRGREAGEAALQGLLLSADKPATQGHSAVRLVYRDDTGDADRAVEAFNDLTSVHRVIAVIGPMSPAPARAVAARAKQLGMPLILLNPDPNLPREASSIFRLLPEPSEEALLLVKRAAKLGARSYAVLHPEGPFGESMRAAFEAAVAAQGGKLAGAVSYPVANTSFVREAEAIERLAADAVVLADAASRLTLLAPALAAKGVWSVARGSRPPEGRATLYLVPAAGFDVSLAQTTRRYLQGALFAVPFDATRAGDFAAAYRDQFQAEPNLFSAAAYDAFHLVRTALQSGAQTRDALARALATLRNETTVTASAGFSPSRGPNKPVLIETLLGEGFVTVE
jgi:branched-chain amino acid transport system substrate-binding protein